MAALRMGFKGDHVKDAQSEAVSPDPRPAQEQERIQAYAEWGAREFLKGGVVAQARAVSK